MSTVFDQTFDALAVDKANSRLTIRVWAEENAGALIWKAQCTKAETLLYGSNNDWTLMAVSEQANKAPPQATRKVTYVYEYANGTETQIVTSDKVIMDVSHYRLIRLDIVEIDPSGGVYSSLADATQKIRTYINSNGQVIQTTSDTPPQGRSGVYAYGNEPVSFQLKIDDQVSEIVQGIQKVNAHSQWNASAGWFAWEDGRGTGIAECRSASPWADRRAFLTIYDGALGSRDILLFGDGATYSVSEDERLAHGHIFLRTRAGWKVIL